MVMVSRTMPRMERQTEIPLTNGGVAILDARDFERVNRLTWFRDSVGYAAHNGGIAGPYIRMHRYIMGMLPGLAWDHKNGNRLDNRRTNLRLATTKENIRNGKRARNNTTGYKGVYHRRDTTTNPWRAKIVADGRQICLGQYATAEAAALAYNDGAILHFGKFARLNEVPNA